MTDLPDGWIETTLGEIAEIRPGVNKPVDHMGSGTRYVTVQDLYVGTSINTDRLGRCRLTPQEVTRYRLERGDIVFSKSSVKRDGIGYPSRYLGSPEPVVHTGFAYRARVAHEMADPTYVFYALRAGQVRRWVINNSQSSALTNMNARIASAIPVRMPTSVAEQRRIGVLLSDADFVIGALEGVIGKKQAIKQGMMQRLMAGEVDDGWTETSVRGVVTRTFSGPSPTCEERNIRGDEWGVLKTTCSTWEHGWDDTKHKVLPRSFWGQDRIQVRPDDSIITKAGPRHRVGVPAFVTAIGPRIIPSGKMICLRPHRAMVEPGFLALALADSRTQSYLDQRTTGMAESQVNFENQDLLNAPLWIPDLRAQRRILQPLTSADNLLASLRQRLAKEHNVRNGMMQELLTGRTRLPVREGRGMSDVGQIERKTQDRVLKLFSERLDYEYLGNWEYRDGNTNVEVDLLTANLKSRGYDDNLVNRAIDRLTSNASLGRGRHLYEANQDVYRLLRYGVHVKPSVGEQTETIWLIDWKNPEANHFAIAEEVTVAGSHTKRPDLVLYLNGIAVGTVELKRSKVAVSEGIRQTIGNQKADFIRPFFTTVQLVMAGNDVEGLHYAVIDTPEKYWLAWREDSDVEQPLDRALTQLCSKERLLERIHDFMVFDAGVKKTCRHNQYFGVKAAQARVAQREGGIIWHTQGSGKSLIMVWLAKWIRENQPDARVLLITDRTELDDQIEKVFLGVNEEIYRTKSGTDMLATLNQSTPWLVCSLIHKFRASEEEEARDDAEADFIAELRAKIPKDFKARGNLFVFVDEAHRTQSGKMHDAMRELLPEAMFIGFTGTPLLKTDKETSIEKFGSFIHTYKFDEAVADGVVLDLRYEARTIDQDLTSRAKVDAWFEAKTKGMTDLSKAELKKRWGTMQRVVSSEPRARQIVTDVLFDMEIKPRLMAGRGNAMLVGSSIYQACKFYELFSQAGLKGKCAVITSYEPYAGDISKEDSGEGATEKLRQYEIYRQMLADYFDEPANEAVKKVERFETEVKDQFVKNPGQMRLLIVVDKLLTGFDAPSATYLYIDKNMQNHGLFQAICRVNRLDGDDKDYGYIIDYRDLFNSLETAITDYTSGALDGYEKEDIQGLLSDRIDKARQDLDDALERIRALCEPVEPPKNTLQYQRYFCATEPGDADQIKANEPKRVELYKSVASLTRSYANLANEMTAAGYSESEATAVKDEVAHYANVRDEVKLGAGEDVDFKQYEAGMRHLLDTYISAKPSEILSNFEDAGLIELIVQLGPGAIDKLPEGIKKDPEAVAETITNNIRKVIIDERPLNPKYYDRMSELLDAILDERRKGALEYKAYLEKLLEHAAKIGKEESETAYPDWADNSARKALVDFFDGDDELPAKVDHIITTTKPDSWVGDKMKERLVKRAIRAELPDDVDQLDELFELVKARHEYH